MRIAARTIIGASVALLWMVASTTAAAMDAREVYRQAGPAVVVVLGSDGGNAGSGGTGSIITPDGKVITNAHVVLNERNQPLKSLWVFLKPPRLTGDNRKDLSNRYRARVLSYSPADQLDLALLQIENPPPNLPTIAFADPNKVDIGQSVVAIGHPEQGGLWTLTTGTISTVIANFNGIKGKDVFQTEASVNRGNSGGPLLDEQGNMVAINTAIARQGSGGVAITAVNFSLKSSVAVKWLANQGMGLAYADPKPAKQKEREMVVALAPAPQPQQTPDQREPTRAQPTPPPETKPTVPALPTEPQKVREVPPSTIVVAEAPPKRAEAVREQGRDLGKQKSKEKVQKGKRLDPSKAPEPTYHTEKRPFNMDELRAQQMREMEDMMKDMRKKVQQKKSGRGMGLW